MPCNIGPVLFVNQFAGSSKTDGQTDRQDKQTEGEAGPKLSWSNRHKERNSRLQRTEVKPPPGGGHHRQNVPLPHAGTEVSPTSLRHCGKVRDLLLLCTRGTPFLLLSYFQVHPTVSHVRQTKWQERKRENYCMRLDNLAPLSQCSCGPVPVYVCQKKEEQKTKRDEVKERESFRVVMAFYTL